MTHDCTFIPCAFVDCERMHPQPARSRPFQREDVARLRDTIRSPQKPEGIHVYPPNICIECGGHFADMHRMGCSLAGRVGLRVDQVQHPSKDVPRAEEWTNIELADGFALRFENGDAQRAHDVLVGLGVRCGAGVAGDQVHHPRASYDMSGNPELLCDCGWEQSAKGPDWWEHIRRAG